MVKFTTIQSICIGYIIIWMIAPPLSYGMTWRLLACISAGVWFLLQNLKYKEYYNTGISNEAAQLYYLSFIIYILCYLLLDVFYKHMSFVSAMYNNITIMIQFFVGYVAIQYVREERYSEIMFFFKVAAVTATLFSLTSIFRSSEYYELTRAAGEYQTAAQEALTRSAAIHGVGAFGFFCFTSIFAVCVLLMSFHANTRRERNLEIIAYIIIETGVISAGYTLALLISVFGTVMCLFFNLRSSKIKMLILVFALFLLLFGKDLLNGIYSFLSSITEGTMYANKVDDILAFIISGENTGSFESRSERYLISLNSIIKYPVFGSLVLAGARVIGYHSSILDTFAQFGWIPGFCWFYVIGIFPAKLVMCNEYTKQYRLILPLLMILTGMFNTYAINLAVIYLVIPAIIHSIKTKQDLL